jgi:DNA-binding transcriptional LysR family regulator
MDSKRLDLNLLITLEALLAERNVTKAAKRLHLSQPAISAQLARLRELFDDPLLVPAQRGMTPTAKAQELMEPLRQALDQLRATVDTHKNFDPASARLTVTIACTDYLQAALVMPLIGALRQQAPGVRVAIRNLDLPQLEGQMLRGDVDMAFMTPQHGPSNLRSRHLFDERYVLIGCADHPDLHPGLTVEAYAQLEHIIVSLNGADFATSVDDALSGLGFKRCVVLAAASFLFVPQMVSRSRFVALVPERLIRDRTQPLRIVEPPFPVAGFAVAMMWHERTHDHPGYRWIRQQVVALVNAESRSDKSSRVE